MEAQIKWDITHILKANHHKISAIMDQVEQTRKERLEKEQEKGA